MKTEEEAKIEAIRTCLAEMFLEIANALDNRSEGVPQKILAEYPEAILKVLNQVEIDYHQKEFSL